MFNPEKTELKEKCQTLSKIYRLRGHVKRQMSYSVLFYRAELESIAENHKEVQNRGKPSDENCPRVDLVP